MFYEKKNSIKRLRSHTIHINKNNILLNIRLRFKTNGKQSTLITRNKTFTLLTLKYNKSFIIITRYIYTYINTDISLIFITFFYILKIVHSSTIQFLILIELSISMNSLLLFFDFTSVIVQKTVSISAFPGGRIITFSAKSQLLVKIISFSYF